MKWSKGQISLLCVTWISGANADENIVQIRKFEQKILRGMLTLSRIFFSLRTQLTFGGWLPYEYWMSHRICDMHRMTISMRISLTYMIQSEECRLSNFKPCRPKKNICNLTHLSVVFSGYIFSSLGEERGDGLRDFFRDSWSSSSIDCVSRSTMKRHILLMPAASC